MKLYLLESLESRYEPCRLQPVWKPIFNYMNADIDKIIYMGIPISISTKINKAFSIFILLNHCQHWFSKYGFVAFCILGICLSLGTVFILFLQVDAIGSLKWDDGIFPHFPNLIAGTYIALIAPVKKSRMWIRGVGCLV